MLSYNCCPVLLKLCKGFGNFHQRWHYLWRSIMWHHATMDPQIADLQGITMCNSVAGLLVLNWSCRLEQWFKIITPSVFLVIALGMFFFFPPFERLLISSHVPVKVHADILTNKNAEQEWLPMWLTMAYMRQFSFRNICSMNVNVSSCVCHECFFCFWLLSFSFLGNQISFFPDVRVWKV